MNKTSYLSLLVITGLLVGSIMPSNLVFADENKLKIKIEIQDRVAKIEIETEEKEIEIKGVEANKEAIIHTIQDHIDLADKELERLLEINFDASNLNLELEFRDEFDDEHDEFEDDEREYDKKHDNEHDRPCVVEKSDSTVFYDEECLINEFEEIPHFECAIVEDGLVWYDKQCLENIKSSDMIHDRDSSALEQRIAELEEENQTLRETIGELEQKIKDLNILLREQLKVIYEWIISR